MSDDNRQPGMTHGTQAGDSAVSETFGHTHPADARQGGVSAGGDFDEGFSAPIGGSAAADSGKKRMAMLHDGGSRRMLVVAGLVFVIVGVGVYYNFIQRSVLEQSTVSRAPSLDSTPGGQRQAQSPRYQETLERANQERAREAREGGGNFIPTVEQIATDVNSGGREGQGLPDGGFDRRERQPAIPPATIRTRVSIPETAQQTRQQQQVATSTGQRQENPYIEIMGSQIGLAVRTWSPKPSAAVDLPPSRRAEELREIEEAIHQARLDAIQNPAASQLDPSDGDIVVRAGGLVYARMVNSVNSDTRSPVLVEIVSGPLKGARMIGDFSPVPASDGLSVTFRSIVLEDGRSTSVSAYAVDGFTAESLVASSVDRRLLARYGPLLAASFVTGLADAFANTGSTIADIGGVAVVTRPEATLEQAAAAGVAQAASAISSDLGSSAPRGPLIKLESGYPVAIMFMQTLVDLDGEIVVWDSQQAPPGSQVTGVGQATSLEPSYQMLPEAVSTGAPGLPSIFGGSSAIQGQPRSGFEIIQPRPPIQLTIDAASAMDAGLLPGSGATQVQGVGQ